MLDTASTKKCPDDLESNNDNSKSDTGKPGSVYQGLGWLDRLLALWILLAIIIGIVLGNFVEGVGPALQRGKFVQVSVPIGKSESSWIIQGIDLTLSSYRAFGHDVSDPLQSQV